MKRSSNQNFLNSLTLYENYMELDVVIKKPSFVKVWE